MKYIILLTNILRDLFGIDADLVCQENYNKPFTGPTFRLNYRDLVYLFFEIEKRSGIQLYADEMTEYQFNTIDGVVRFLQQQRIQNMRNS